jgi:cyclomaltodextrinase
VVLATVGGTPAIYYGDEQAYRGVKEDRAGGDDEVRPPYPPTPDDLAGPDVAPDGWATHDRHAALLGLRRRHPWLHTARTRVVEVTNTRLAYEARASDGSGAALLVALNLDAGPWALAVPAGASVAAHADPAVAPGTRPGPGSSVDVPGPGWVVLEV